MELQISVQIKNNGNDTIELRFSDKMEFLPNKNFRRNQNNLDHGSSEFLKLDSNMQEKCFAGKRTSLQKIIRN